MLHSIKLNCSVCGHPILGVTEELSAVFAGGTSDTEASPCHFWCYYRIGYIHPGLLELPRADYERLLAVNQDRAAWFTPVDKESSYGDGIPATREPTDESQADG